MKSAGWAGILCLPRDISLEPSGTLRIEPVPELEALRRDHRNLSGLTLGSHPTALAGVSGSSLEISASIDPLKASRIGVAVLASPNGEEETAVIADLEANTLTLDPSRSSLSPDFVGADPQVAPFGLAPGERLELRIFIDRSIVEVFANSRQCVTKRVYPTRPDSLGVRLFSRGGESIVRSLDAYKLG